MATSIESAPKAIVRDRKEEKAADEHIVKTETPRTASQKLLDIIYFTPSWCRWSEENPPPFTIWHNLLYACAAGFSAANSFYSAPILNILAEDFGTSYAGVSAIPSIAQGGGAAGLLLILPLGDVLPKRRFTLTLVSLAMLTWIPLCLTSHLPTFLAFSFLSALFNGAPQIFLPLVSELSEPSKRAFNISIIGSGATLGILIARILSGIVTNFTSWRNVYWTGLGLQIIVLASLWICMPDYPATKRKTAKEVARGYSKLIWSIVMLYPKHPILVQSALISFCTFAALTSYWTTLTFVLSSPVYDYSSLVIGLFGLVAVVTMLAGPIYGKYIIQPLKQPLYSVLVGQTISLSGVLVGSYAGLHNVSALLIQAVLQDAGLTIVQISNRMSIYPVAPDARNRVNSAFVCIMCLGQLMGTSVGSTAYDEWGGWQASGTFGVVVLVAGYVIVALRGPNEQGWIGWSGGWGRGPAEADEEIAQDIEASAAAGAAMVEELPEPEIREK